MRLTRGERITQVARLRVLGARKFSREEEVEEEEEEEEGEKEESVMQIARA